MKEAFNACVHLGFEPGKRQDFCLGLAHSNGSVLNNNNKKILQSFKKRVVRKEEGGNCVEE